MATILVTGAAGFIARQIIAELLKNNHTVVGCAREISFVKTIFPMIDVIACDFLQDTDPQVWMDRLQNLTNSSGTNLDARRDPEGVKSRTDFIKDDGYIEVVINCVGVFQLPKLEDTWKIHYHTPKALFTACEKMGVRKIVHISALGIERDQQPYSLSKLKIEQYLRDTCLLDVTILKPSLVYGEGSYSGSSLFRGLVSLPFILPIPSKGRQKFQPIHIADLARIAKESIALTGKQTLAAVSAQTVDLKTILTRLRSWLGFKKAMLFYTPFWWIRLVAKLGDYFAHSPINTTAYRLMQHDSVADSEQQRQLQQVLSFSPRSFEQALLQTPSQVQDRWHARLFFLKPLLRYSLAFIWLWTALVSLFIFPHHDRQL